MSKPEKVVWIEHSFAPRWKWTPVYYPAHSDPELGARPHYHVAWNRLTQKQQDSLLRYWEDSTELSGIVIFARQSQAFDLKRSTKIVGPPVAPRLSREFMQNTWAQLRTP